MNNTIAGSVIVAVSRSLIYNWFSNDNNYLRKQQQKLFQVRPH